MIVFFMVLAAFVAVYGTIDMIKQLFFCKTK